MNYEEALDFIETAKWKGSVPGLDRIRILMHQMGDPQDSLKFIHIAGTNGKGSTAAMTASILTEAGYRTGLHTSPHLVKYNERFKINGQDISDEALCEAAQAVKDAEDALDEPLEVTVFERMTAMAFYYFAKEKCDFVVLEVGLGGRFDATNVIKAPEAAVICNLDLEHTELLGNTIEEIAFEKGGIIKTGAPVVLYGQTAEAEGVIKSICEEQECSLVITDQTAAEVTYKGSDCQVFDYRGRKNIQLSLIGTYQLNNALTVLDTIDELKKKYDIPEEAVYAGLKNASWPGRFQVLLKDPYVLLDGAHNPNGVNELVKCLKDYFPGVKFTFMCGVMADKDYDSMLSAVAPLANGFLTVTPESHRALESSALEKYIEEHFHLPAEDAGSVPEGLKRVLEIRNKGENVCIFGSLYEVGDVFRYFKELPH